MPPSPTPADLDHLLELQSEDTAVMRLQERKATLPEAARLSEVRARVTELESDSAIATRQASEIARDQARLEGEIEVLESKIAKQQQRLFSGSVSNPKELSSLQSEVAMFERQKATAEDALLEVMVSREAADATRESLTAELSQASGEAAELQTQVEKLTDEIDGELSEHSARRSELAAGLPPDLVSLYERVRAQKGGVGAAELVGGTCQGCHTKLPAVEVERVKREGGLQRCDNCRRILVVR